ncbi:MAG: hypothetical protein ACP5PX_08225 [Candidatus Hadarchaeum sp.]|uniref:hypothetical protein n=1 Tax=Candidatus Hadarchaeum sp. TaxID=2883567 RepID=UPI003D0E5CF8
MVVSEVLLILCELGLLAGALHTLLSQWSRAEVPRRILPLTKGGSRVLAYPAALPPAIVAWLTVPLVGELTERGTETSAELLWGLAILAVASSTLAALIGFLRLRAEKKPA